MGTPVVHDPNAAWWAGLTHKEKAEALLDTVDYRNPGELALPVLAMAQAHATLALEEKP